MKTLAQQLGVTPADLTSADASLSFDISQPTTIESFCRGVLESVEYRLSVMNRITLGELSPAVETLMYHYGYGKPVERVEVKDTTHDLDELSVDDLERRAIELLEQAKQLRSMQGNSIH